MNHVESDAQNWARQVRAIAVIGAGTMGEGIAQSFAEAGISVRLLDVSAAALARCTRQIGANLQLAMECGFGVGPATAILERIEAVRSDEPALNVGEVQAVIETVPEIPELKRAIFLQLDKLPADILLCSNTRRR